MAGLFHEPVQPAREVARDVGLPRVDVGSLLRIRGEIVQLGPRRLDELVSPRAQRVQRAPPELEARGHRLAVGVLARVLARVEHHGQQRSAVDAGGRVDPREREDGGVHVHRAHLPLDAHAAQFREGCRHDERHVHRVVVDEVAVRPFAVPAEALSVVADHHDGRLTVETVRLQPRQQPPHLLIGEGDLAVVEAGHAARAELRAEGLRRLVGRVRVVEVDPGEERLLRAALEPGQRSVDHLVGGPLHAAEVEVLVLLQVEAIVVDLEALVEAPPAVEDERADERSRRVALLPQGFGDRLLLRPQRGVSVDAHAVMGRVHARHDRGVRRLGQRRRRGGLGEEDAAPREAVEVRGARPRIAVAAEMVGARRVQRDEDDVGLLDTLPRPQAADDVARVGGRTAEPPEARGNSEEDQDRGRDGRDSPRPPARRLHLSAPTSAGFYPRGRMEGP